MKRVMDGESSDGEDSESDVEDSEDEAFIDNEDVYLGTEEGYMAAVEEGFYVISDDELLERYRQNTKEEYDEKRRLEDTMLYPCAVRKAIIRLEAIVGSTMANQRSLEKDVAVVSRQALAIRDDCILLPKFANRIAEIACHELVDLETEL
jgi:hypothetical protein